MKTPFLKITLGGILLITQSSISAATLNEDDSCLSKSSQRFNNIKDIPCLMRKKNWSLASNFMNHWFSGTGESYNLNFKEITDLSIEAVDAANELNRKANNQNIMSNDMWVNLIALLKNTPNSNGDETLSEGGAFSFTATGHKNWVNEITIGDDSSIAFKATFGHALLRFIANGKVVITDNGSQEINVTEVGVYLADSYDFKGEQFLGFWDYRAPYVNIIPRLTSKAIHNRTFRAYNTSLGLPHNQGDFRVFSNVYSVQTDESYLIEAPVASAPVAETAPTPIPETVDPNTFLPPVCEIGTSPQVVTYTGLETGVEGGTALWWWTDHGTSATISDGVGSIDITSTSNYIWFYPSKTTSYTMTLQGENGTTSTCTTEITVIQP
jgi:hypothetical protein